MAFHLHHGVVAGTEILQLPPGTSRHCHRAQLADAHHIRQCESGLELRQLVGGRHEQRQVPRKADRVLVRQEGGVGRDHYLRECVRCDVGDVRRLHVCSAVALHIRPDNVGQCRRRRGRLVAFGGGWCRPHARAQGEEAAHRAVAHHGATVAFVLGQVLEGFRNEMALTDAAAAAAAAVAAAADAAKWAENGQHSIFSVAKPPPESFVFLLSVPSFLPQLLELCVRILFRQATLRLNLQPLHGSRIVFLVVPRGFLPARVVQRGDHDKLLEVNVRGSGFIA
jgi:hypothetical protein